jgi:hypothetical protein
MARIRQFPSSDFVSDVAPTKKMEVRAQTEYVAYRKAIDFESAEASGCNGGLLRCSKTD